MSFVARVVQSIQSRSLRDVLILSVTLLPMVVRAAEPQADVSIEQVKWGFDGKVQPQTFVPLSLLLRNNSAGEFEGTLQLSKSVQYTKPIDALVEHEVYLGPVSSRWVQFVPYIFGDWEQWQLTWKGIDAEPFHVPTPNLGDRATVLLYNPDELQASGGILHRFPADLFPTSVTALDGLRGVVFDHPPGWQGARRQAFLDWLKLGGRAYLLQDEQGGYPSFAGSLSLFNRGGDRVPVGAGLIRRLPRTIRSLDRQSVDEEILHDEQNRFNTPDWQRFRQSPTFRGSALLINQQGWDRDTDLLEHLQSLSRFERNWIVIYGLVIVYVLALFPGCYWLGRRHKAYQWFYPGFFLVTGLFSVGFASLGRLGAAELARVRSVAVARQLDDGLYDLTGWSSAAVKIGGDYTIQHEGTGRLYTAASEFEVVKGRVVSGPNGRLEANMPPASTRSSIHRTRQKGPSLGITVKQAVVETGSLAQLVISTGPEFPDAPLSVHAWHQGQAYRMQRDGTEWRLVPFSRKEGASFLAEVLTFRLPRLGMTPRAWSNLADDDRPAKDDYGSMIRALMGNSFGLNNMIDPFKLMLRPNLMRVFVYARLPKQFQVMGDAFPDQYGCVLYVVDLPTSPTGGVTLPRSGDAPSESGVAEE